MELEQEIERLRARVRELETSLGSHAGNDPFRRVVESAPYGMVVSDARGRILMVNPQAEAMFGYPAPEFVTKCIEDLVPVRFRGGHASLREGFHATPEPRPMGEGRDLHGCRSDGSEFPIEIALTPLASGGDTLVLSAIIDITRRKRDEEELRRYAKRLERINAELESFASIASHDLQEPLRKIRMMGERLADIGGERLGDQGMDYLGRMIRAGDNMHRLIRDLLAFSRVGSGPGRFRLLSLEGPVRDALTALDLMIEETGAEVLVRDLPEAEVDEALLRQLFQNLIGNALKFRREGVPPRIEVCGEIPGDREDPVRCEVVIEVRDNGIGFDEQFHDRIFQVFQRLHSRAEFEGTGIGLAICKKIVDHHEGRIHARSRPGEGAVFSIILPARQRAAEENHLEGR